MKEEYLDIPTEITDGSRAQQLLSKAQKEKEEYEEAYLTRLPVTKVEKHRQRKLTTLGLCRMNSNPPDMIFFSFSYFYCLLLRRTGTLGDEITSFGNINALSGNASASAGTSSKKRKQKTGSKKRGGKKRKFH